ncbi:acylphosphatase [Gracilibacillus oryzae]|uniref:acylphosphatase n=1 Tax=Gracilibacillus oryzae TaxID=1672701 RepID=UPI00389957AB
MKNIHAFVEGKVQGVGFRYFTQSTAIDHNITGWVRNLDDGSVEILAQGEEGNLDSFIEKIKKGPSMFAKVTDVKIEEFDDSKEHSNFEIKM